MKSKVQADLALRAQWAGLVLGACAGIKQTLSFLLSMEIKAALSVIVDPGQLTVSASQPLEAAFRKLLEAESQHPGLLEVPRLTRLGWAAGASPRTE